MSHETITHQPLLKQAALQIAAGGSAGFVEVCIMHPLDLVKTRLQIQTKGTNNASAPNSVRHCIAQQQNRSIKVWDLSGVLQWRLWLLQKNVPQRGIAGLVERYCSADSGRNPEESHQIRLLRAVQTILYVRSWQGITVGKCFTCWNAYSYHQQLLTS